jgi:hypothetical protein
MGTISPYQLHHYFAATGEELLRLRCLVDPDDDGNFEQSAACRALLAIRGSSPRQADQQARKAVPSGLLARLRRGMNRRVPPQ